MGDVPSTMVNLDGAGRIDDRVSPGAPTLHALGLGLAVAAAYVAAAVLGFQVAFVAEQVTTVWAPTGIALAALLVGGLRLWPAVWIGAFLANASTDAPIWTALVIATGNTIESVVAVSALRRLRHFDVTLHRAASVPAFIVIAALGCTAISATIGVATLSAAGVQPWARFPTLWINWWLGDALGALVVAPALLTTLRHDWSTRDRRLAFVWLATTGAVTHAVFGPTFGTTPHPLEYVVFPVVIGAAFTGPAITSLVVLTASAVAIWHTVHGSGPFAGGEVHQRLVLLQTFMGVLAGTALLLAAALAERQRTERRERETAEDLRRREQMLLLAQRAGGVATFEWDFGNQIARCSAEFFRVLGLPAEDGEMTAREWSRFVHPDDRELMTAHLGRAIEGSEPAAADYRIVGADGVTRWLSYAGLIQRTADGLRMLGTVVDITDRKRLEAELRHHATEVERILESIGEGFVSFDREFRYVYVNSAAERLLGRARAELMGRTPWEVFSEGTIREARPLLEEAMRSGTPIQYQRSIPEWSRCFENRVYPSPTGLSIFFADVTAHVAAEQALRESSNVLALAMRSGAMGAYSRNLATNEVWWSRELEEIFGLEPGAFDRTEAGFYTFVHPDDRAAVHAAVASAIANRADYIVEFRFQHAGGDWRWMEGRGRAVYNDDGSPRSVYGIGIDVTARKRTELALGEAKLAAESANQLKDQFLATLSHELRTPLNAILGYVRMLQTNTIAPEKRQRAMDVIERNAVAQNQLVEDLLDMSRITTGKVRLDPRPVPVAAVLRETVEGVRPAADAKGLELELDIDPFAGMVLADATRLQQVFWNVLTNAVKFTGDGGRVAVSLRRNGSSVDISVADTGSGISPSFLPFVFEPFRQGESREQFARGGLGLGLAITKQLVQLHGGTISVSSGGIGQGATFTIQLACLADDIMASDGAASAYVQRPSDDEPRRDLAVDAPPEPRVSLAGVNVLLVDDEQDTRAMLRDALEDAGASVRAVSSAADALREADTWRPDVLVTDFGLPGTDGYALLQALRSRPSAPACRAVAVSAYARLDDRSRALAAGFEAHLAKPIDPATLVRTVRATLGAPN